MCRPNHILLIVLLLPLSAFLFCKKDNSENPPVHNNDPVELKDSIIADGLRFPWEIVWGPDDHIWLTERTGKISRLNPSTGALSPVITINDVVSNGEGGLLGMALDPSFASNKFVYVVYNTGGNYREKIVRFTYNGTTLTSPLTLLDNINAASIHNGSRLLIVNDKLFITTGDANNTSLAQNTSSLNGKILRINLDGTIPSDNPIAGSAIWSIGHRNPQGLVYANNKLYSSEHGPSNDDEINIIEKGRNYGWPNVEGMCNTTNEQSFCNTNNVAQPIKTWTPTTAPSGMEYYNNDLIPQWKNSLLLTALKDTRLYQLKLNESGTAIESTTEFYVSKYGRMRDVCISPTGKVYICTSNGTNDKIIEISKK